MARGIAMIAGLALVAAVPTVPAFAVTTSFTAGCTSGVAGLTSTIDFAGPAAVDGAGFATYSGSFFNLGTNPCGSDHLAIGNGRLVTISFSQPIDYFGMAWGTKDTFNFVDVYSGATLLASVITNGVFGTEYLNIFAGAGESFDRIVLLSSGNFFETDNHSYRVAPLVDTPAPAGLGLLGLGLAAFALRASRRG